MIIKLSPAIRREIIDFAAQETLSFDAALECMVSEGIKAISEKKFPKTPRVYKSRIT